ncbi:MAG: phosphate ABC transporter substrate-binding protein, PhoT family [Ruminococcus sp.]|nr:phosphate ABC transporter substrate-binding protein, PhoT family [Ruminococcus sp.]
MKGAEPVKKLTKQLLCIGSLSAMFLAFDLGIYHCFTKRCTETESAEFQAKSVEVSAYLPFDADSAIVRHRSEVQLTGDLPVMDGAAALFPMYSAFAHALYPEDSCPYAEGDFLPESAVQFRNTGDAYRAIADGTADVIFCARPAEYQLQYAADRNVELVFQPIGKEAFVFVVNSQNPVNTLTCQQVRGIYSGEYTNWSQLGGENTPIAALQRIHGSGSQSVMESFMGEVPMVKDYDTFLGRAIGFSFRYYVEGIVEKGGVKLLSLEGIAPTAENIRNGSYPVVSEIYAIYRKDDTSENLAQLLTWIMSDEGQRIVEETGYVPYTAAPVTFSE